MAIKVIIHWDTRNEAAIEAIRKQFHLPNYTTINGLTPGVIEESEMDSLNAMEKLGLLAYRFADWTFNGATYSW